MDHEMRGDKTGDSLPPDINQPPQPTLPPLPGEDSQPEKPGALKSASIPVRLIASAAVVGAVLSLLFVRQELGLNMMLLVLLIYAFALLNQKLFVVKKFRDDPFIYLLTLPVIALGVLLFTGSSSLNALTVLAIVLVMFVQFLVVSGAALHDWDRPAFIIDMVFGGINRFFLSLGRFSAGVFNQRLFRRKGGKNKGVLYGVLTGAVLLIIVLPLLSLADPEMNRLLFDFFSNFNVGDVFLYAFAFYAVASLVAGPVAMAKCGEASGKRKSWVNEGKRPIMPVTATIALTMVCTVYVLFAALQMRYFFSPNETIETTMNLTRSGYAVRGFGEMVFISCLNFILIAACLRFVAKDNKNVYLKILLTLLIAFNFIIMASAHMRMAYYEAEFGYTVARLLSHSFMVLLAVLGVMMLVRIYVKFKTFKLAFALMLVYLCTITAINPERFVTQRNIARYEVTGEVDSVYSLRLSGDAVADMCGFLQEHPELVRNAVRRVAVSKREQYRHKDDSWQSTNIAERRAAAALESLFDE